jgi:hypothetical protein
MTGRVHRNGEESFHADTLSIVMAGTSPAMTDSGVGFSPANHNNKKGAGIARAF